MTHPSQSLKELIDLRERHLDGSASHEAFFASADRKLPQIAEYVGKLEAALRPFANATLLNQSSLIVAGDAIKQAFDSGKKHVTMIMEEDALPAFNAARSALSPKDE